MLRPVALTPDGLVDTSVEVFEKPPVLLNEVNIVADVSVELLLLVVKLLELFPVPIRPLPAAVLLLLAVPFQKA